MILSKPTRKFNRRSILQFCFSPMMVRWLRRSGRSGILMTGKREQMKSLEEIETILRAHKDELREKYRIKELGLFGSVVRGEHKRGSDVDILVDFDQVPDLLRFIELERYLKKLIGNKVDLIEKTSIRPELKNIILEEARFL